MLVEVGYELYEDLQDATTEQNYSSIHTSE